MTKDEIKLKLEGLLSPKRYIHSINVMNTAEELAENYGEDIEKASTAGLLHDCARDIRGGELFRLCKENGVEVNYITRLQPELLHGPLGSKLAGTEYGITDENILSAINVHTTGKEKMSILDKIIFLADYIEPGRNFQGVNEVRELAFKDIDRAMVVSLDRAIKHVMSKGGLIHPDTINARNSIVYNKLK